MPREKLYTLKQKELDNLTEEKIKEGYKKGFDEGYNSPRPQESTPQFSSVQLSSVQLLERAEEAVILNSMILEFKKQADDAYLKAMILERYPEAVSLF